MTKSIQRTLLIPQPREQVWHALTESDTLAQWMFPNDFQPKIGHHFTFRVPPNPQVKFDGLTVHCQVLELDPPHRLVFSWSAGGAVTNTRVTFQLESADNGTRILFEHAGFEISPEFGKQAFNGAEYGWTKMLVQLAKLVAGEAVGRVARIVMNCEMGAVTEMETRSLVLKAAGQFDAEAVFACLPQWLRVNVANYIADLNPKEMRFFLIVEPAPGERERIEDAVRRGISELQRVIADRNPNTKRVLVVPPNPAWPAAFITAHAEATPAFGKNLLTLHHIGSTAIPNIHAKPVIDMLAVVQDITRVDPCNPALEQLGYHAKGEFGIPGRRYFYRNDPAGTRTHQIHTFQFDSPDVTRHLAFRDYLRAHPDIAQAYSLLKQKLAADHPQDIEAYMDGKDPFIKETEAKALAWAAS